MNKLFCEKNFSERLNEQHHEKTRFLLMQKQRRNQNPKFQASIFFVTVQAGLCQTWSETPVQFGFLNWESHK